MRHQRGFLGFSAIELVLGGIAIAAAMGAIYGLYEAVGNHFRDQVRAEYAPLIVKCGKRAAQECATEWGAAIDANATLQADVAKLDDERKVCTKSIENWQALAQRAAAVAQQNQKSAESAIAQLRSDRTRSLSKAAVAPTSGETCEQTLAEIDKDSKEFASVRAMLFPPDKAPASERLRIKK